MKGPGMRTDLDVRRVWECPQCGRTRRAEGDITALRCGCTPDGVQMRLVEGRRQVRKFPYPAAEPTPLEEIPPFAGEMDIVEPTESAVPAADAASWVEPPATVIIETVVQDNSVPDVFPEATSDATPDAGNVSST